MRPIAKYAVLSIYVIYLCVVIAVLVRILA